MDLFIFIRNTLRNNIKYYSAIYHLSAQSVFWHQNKDERGEVPKLWKTTLCIANREREEKGKKTYSRSSLAMFIPHIVRVKKSLRGNNVGS